jgi:hypothetical protein
MYIPDIFKFSLSSFFSSPAALCCPSLPLSFGAAWSLFMSMVLVLQGLWLSGSVDLVVCSCSVPVLVCLPSGPCVAFWICLFGSGSLDPMVKWCSIIPPGMFNEFCEQGLCFWLLSSLSFVYFLSQASCYCTSGLASC